MMRRIALACLLAGLGLAAAAPWIAGPAHAKQRAVLSIRLEGPVTPVMAEALDSGLAQAEREQRPALIVELDTPGGLESSMRVMVQRLLAARVPVIVWVGPSGARAASAGVFITLAADVAAMAPGTNIGAATPINMQGPMDSTLARKATNDAAAFARTVAAQRGRNAVWAEDAVRRAVAASETEALGLDVVDLIAANETQLLERAEGRSWRRNDGARVLHVRGLAVEHVKPGLRLRLLALLADPNIAYMLMLFGFYGVMFELQNPGAVLPGIIGGIALVLAMFGLSTLPVNAAGVALLVLAVVFFIAETQVVSHGLLAAGGVVAMLLGSLMLFQGDAVRVSYGVVAGGTLVTALFVLVLVVAGLRALRRPLAPGAAGLAGQRGRVIEALDPQGRVDVGGVVWAARSDAPVPIGQEVVVIAVEGLTLVVRPEA